MTEEDAEVMLGAMLARPGALVRRQVHVGLKRVDLVVCWAGGDVSVLEAIEVKLRDWKRAAHQAYLSGSYSHISSIAVPRGLEGKVDFNYLASLGVGLIVFDSEGWTRVLAPRATGLAPAVMTATLTHFVATA
jgi:hypothetical protein